MKYVPSALIGRLSRSAGSTTAAHNKFGAYLRNRVIPTNPQTSFQTNVRTDMSDLSTSWRTLTPAQREAWISLGDQMERTDSLGEVYSLTGAQAFISVNRNLLTIGEPTVDDAPALQLPAAPVSISPTMTAGLGAITVGFAPSPSVDAMLLFASAPISAGRNFVSSSEMKLIAVVAAAATTPFNAASAYTARFGSITGKEGAKVFWRAITVTDEGFAAPPLQASTIIGA
jgi:hypothetical protein